MADDDDIDVMFYEYEGEMRVSISCPVKDVDDLKTQLSEQAPQIEYRAYPNKPSLRAPFEPKPPALGTGGEAETIGYFISVTLGAGGVTALVKALTSFYKRH